MAAKCGSCLRIRCCSTSFTDSLLLCLSELCHNRFCFPFCPALAVETSGKGVNHRNEIVKQILSIMLCQVDDFKSSPLAVHERLYIAKSKARGLILVLYHDRRIQKILSERLRQK